jgi:cob(I)alamin adenosyltransferase
MFDDYKTKKSVVVVYTGEGKGKTSASIGLMARALGSDWRVAFVQFIKTWEVGEHRFIKRISQEFGDSLVFYKGGKGFFDAGQLSAKGVSKQQHVEAAQRTLEFAIAAADSGNYELVICDEINNAVNDGLLKVSDVKKLIERRDKSTSLCLTGRNFPPSLKKSADILTNMQKVKHHYDDKFLANPGIDY